MIYSIMVWLVCELIHEELARPCLPQYALVLGHMTLCHMTFPLVATWERPAGLPSCRYLGTNLDDPCFGCTSGLGRDGPRRSRTALSVIHDPIRLFLGSFPAQKAYPGWFQQRASRDLYSTRHSSSLIGLVMSTVVAGIETYNGGQKKRNKRELRLMLRW